MPQFTQIMLPHVDCSILSGSYLKPLSYHCINLWSKVAKLGLYEAIKKRGSIFKTSPYAKYAFTLENDQSRLWRD